MTESGGKGLYDDEAYRQMYPEVCFDHISDDVVEKCWKGEKEWWKKEDSLGTGQRIGWECKECRWLYFVRVLESDDVEDPDSDDHLLLLRRACRRDEGVVLGRVDVR
jgi:hypothetical protein